MANEFSEKILTADGKNFIAQAASGNKIIYVKAITSTNYLDSTARLNESNYTGPSTTSVTTSSTNGTVRVVAEFENQASASVVKTVALVAKMESVYTENKIIMIQCDSEYGLYIPSLSDTVSQNTQLFFTLGLSQSGDVVEVTDGGHASKGDFDKLNERAVTTHSPNNPTIGENQTIYGQKTFKNTCIFDDTTMFHNILPSTTETYFLGNSENQWQSLYAINTVIGDTVYSDKLSPNSASSSVGTEQNPYTNVYSTNGHFTSVSSGSLASGTITVSGNIVKSTSSTSNQTIGTSDNPFNTIYGTLSGNASTASKLESVHTIDGFSFDGSTDITSCCTCTTAAQTDIKQANLLYGTTPSLNNGLRVVVKFSYTNTASNPSLKIGNSSALPIYIGTNAAGNTPSTSWSAGDTVEFVLVGNVWNKVNPVYSISGSATSADYAKSLRYSTTTVLTAMSASSLVSTATMRPSNSSTYSLGTASYKWNYVYCNNLGTSSSPVAIAYITNITGDLNGTATNATNAEFASKDSAGNIITSSYVKNISVGSSSKTFSVTSAAGTASTVSGNESNTYITMTKGTASAVSMNGTVASIIAGTGVGSVRWVCCKTTAAWTKKSTYIYMSGSILRPVDMKTDSSDSNCVVRFNAQTSLNNSTIGTTSLPGVWQLLSYVGAISSGDMLVALAVRVY